VSGAEPGLSIVVPAYDEAERLPASLEAAAAYLAARKEPLQTEFIVVDDGSTDRTKERAEESARRLGLDLQVIRSLENRGKGHAVRTGALAARGRLVLVSDADFSTPLSEWEKLAGAGVPVAIGSRAVDPSLVMKRQPLARQTMGRLFNRFVRLLALPGIGDTQCGFKLFSNGAAKEIFSRTRVDRFAYDVEALLLARRLGFPIAEVPVVWINSPDTRVSLFGGAQAYWDLLRIRIGVARTLRERPPGAPASPAQR
jgi:dolichyl-phosphate beta-glucosyltransferase